ncbi:MAG: PaaI family thioesterase [Pseudomonadota bacterium]
MTQPKWPAGPEELMTPAQIAELSGLEFITGIKEGRLPAPPIARALHYRMTHVAVGRVVFTGEPHFDAMNPIGSIHGGWFGTLLDSCMACAVQTHLPKGRAYTTLEYKINILRPLRFDSGAVEAIGETIHVGRRTATAEGKMVGVEDGKTYATGSTTCMIFDL